LIALTIIELNETIQLFPTPDSLSTYI